MFPRKEIFTGKWEFVKGRPKFLKGFFEWKMCVPFAVPSWIYDNVELGLGSFGKMFFFETKWSISMAKRYLPQGNFAYHLPSQFLCVDGKQSKSRTLNVLIQAGCCGRSYLQSHLSFGTGTEF